MLSTLLAARSIGSTSMGEEPNEAFERPSAPARRQPTNTVTVAPAATSTSTVITRFCFAPRTLSPSRIRIGGFRGCVRRLGHVAFALLRDLERAALDRLVQEQERVAGLALEHERANLERAEGWRTQGRSGRASAPIRPQGRTRAGADRGWRGRGVCIRMWISTLTFERLQPAETKESLAGRPPALRSVGYKSDY